MTKNSKKKATSKHGFLKRLKTRTGKALVKRRRLKGRKSL